MKIHGQYDGPMKSYPNDWTCGFQISAQKERYGKLSLDIRFLFWLLWIEI